MRATNIRKGNILRVDGVLYRVMEMVHVTPGKGNAVVQTKLRNIVEGTQTEKRFRSEDDVERVAIDTREMQYLYADTDGFHFMDADTFEQVPMTDEMLGEINHWLMEGIYAANVV